MTNPPIPPTAVIVEIVSRHATVDDRLVPLTNPDQGLIGMIPVYATKQDAERVHGKGVICRGVSQAHQWKAE